MGQPEPICGAPPRRPGVPAGMLAGWDATSLTSPVSLPDVLPSVAALQQGKRHGGEEVLAPVGATLASMTARCPAEGLCALVVFAVPLVNARNDCSERGLGTESFQGLAGLFPRPIFLSFFLLASLFFSKSHVLDSSQGDSSDVARPL